MLTHATQDQKENGHGMTERLGQSVLPHLRLHLQSLGEST